MAHVSSCHMSSSPAEVCLVDIRDWLTSLSGMLDKMLVFNLGKKFHEFFFLKPKILYHKGAQIPSE